MLPAESNMPPDFSLSSAFSFFLRFSGSVLCSIFSNNSTSFSSSCSSFSWMLPCCSLAYPSTVAALTILLESLSCQRFVSALNLYLSPANSATFSLDNFATIGLEAVEAALTASGDDLILSSAFVSIDGSNSVSTPVVRLDSI